MLKKKKKKKEKASRREKEGKGKRNSRVGSTVDDIFGGDNLVETEKEGIIRRAKKKT